MTSPPAPTPPPSKNRNLRVSDYLWNRAMRCVTLRGAPSLSHVIRDLLEDWVRQTEAMEKRGSLPGQQRAAARERRQGPPGPGPLVHRSLVRPPRPGRPSPGVPPRPEG